MARDEGGCRSGKGGGFGGKRGLYFVFWEVSVRPVRGGVEGGGVIIFTGGMSRLVRAKAEGKGQKSEEISMFFEIWRMRWVEYGEGDPYFS